MPRIIWLLFLYCAVFVLLVTMQFARRGSFSLRIADMTVNGRYFPDAAEETDGQPGRKLEGGANVSFGGLEFRLAEAEYITVTDNEAIIALPDGTELSFISQNPNGTQGKQQNGLPELRISGKFSGDVSSVQIPIRPQRSSVIRDQDTLSISYNGSRYRFSRPVNDIDSGSLVLLSSSPSISYRAVADKKENDPADFIITQARTVQSYNDELALRIRPGFELWTGNMLPQVDEDTVIAWCAEAIQHGAYRQAVSVIPAGFSTSSGRTWESAVYQFDRRTGVWNTAVRAIGELERETAARITTLLADRDISLFAGEHLIEFLAIRGLDNIIDDLLLFARNADPSDLAPETSAGILECFLDMERLYPGAVNPFDTLTEYACRIVAGELRWAGDGVFVLIGGQADIEFNLRLGLALQEWGEKTGKPDWAALGRSLVLSVFFLGDEDGTVPAYLAMSGSGYAASPDRISAARLYRLLGGNEFLPHAAATGTKGVWAWTAASSVNVTVNEKQMDIYVRFPVNETHYIMLRGVKPFPLLQIYDSNWRRASDFESYYDSSGWNYFESEQTLVLKIRHRSNTEHIKILYVVPRVEPPPPSPEEQQPEAPGNAGE